MDKQQAVEYIQQELAEKRSQADISAALSQKLGAPLDLVSKFVSQEAAKWPSPLANQNAASKADSSSKVSSSISEQPDPEIRQYILRELEDQHEENDIIVTVCERTGLQWDQAQGLVSEVMLDNRKQIVTRQNFLLVPLSGLALLAGVALVWAGLTESFFLCLAILKIWANTICKMPPGADVTLQSGPWAVFTGLGLTLGGTAGLAKALRAQFE